MRLGGECIRYLIVVSPGFEVHPGRVYGTRYW
jgi:hypothetical protein